MARPERRPPGRRRYGLILLAPPTWSRSKAMRGDFDVVRDHARLLGRCLPQLAPGGEILFSTHGRGGGKIAKLAGEWRATSTARPRARGRRSGSAPACSGPTRRKSSAGASRSEPLGDQRGILFSIVRRVWSMAACTPERS